jgi:hypothetical protein
MKATFTILLSVIVLIATRGVARAWDAPQYWYESDTIGGGGILATGGAGDHNITCANCHIKGAQNYGTVDFKPSFNPPIGTSYQLGQTYLVTMTLSNEHLGLDCPSMGMDMHNKNFFGAAFEDDSGKAVGQLTAGNGTTASCPTPPLPNGQGNPTTDTFMFSDCHAIIGGGENTTGATTSSWTFSWTAPTTSTNVTVYYAGVDGNCEMDSLGDDAKVGTMKLGGGLAMRAPAESSNRAFASVGLFPLLAMLRALRRRATTAARYPA